MNHVIDSVLVQERQGGHKETVGDFYIKWIVQVDVIFVCVYSRFFRLMYIDQLLQLVQARFNEMFDARALANQVCACVR